MTTKMDRHNMPQPANASGTSKTSPIVTHVGYWYGNGKHQGFANQLNKLIPQAGAVPNPKKNKALEKFRKASNIYYDLYNNGLWNTAGEFSKVFGFGAKQHKGWKGDYSEYLHEMVEQKMDEFVLDAAAEQLSEFARLHGQR